MLDHSLSEAVEATFVALNDVHHELHHVVLDGSLLVLHSVDFLHATLDLSHDKLACVPIDQNDPLVDQEFLRFELDFDRLQHFYCLYNDREGGFWHRRVILLE